MKLVTFNIRCDFRQDGANNFEFRGPLILNKLRTEMPDVICFQEVLPHVADWLRDGLRDYHVIGCGREKDLSGEQVTVAFRADRFSLLKMDSFWLSDTPMVPGSRYAEQSDCPRICTEAVLQNRDTGMVFRLVNTHFDHIGSLARMRSAQQIIQRLESLEFLPDSPLIFCGDLNAEPDSPEIALLRHHFELLTPDTGITFHGYGCPKTSQIDYVFARGNVHCNAYGLWKDQIGDVWLSDHYPLWTDISLG